MSRKHMKGRRPSAGSSIRAGSHENSHRAGVGDPSPARIAAESRSQALCLLIIAVATIVAYSNSFTGEFIVDDALSIVQSRTIRTLWPLTDYLASSRPLVDYSLGINFAIHGLERPGYHVVNLAIHILAAWTLFGLLRQSQRLLQQGSGGARAESSAGGLNPGDGAALAAALIWAVHPLQTQSVTYLIQRSESLMGLCYLLVIYCVARSATAPRLWPWAVGAVLACAGGMTSKAVMVTAPIAAILYDRVFIASSVKEMIRRRWPMHVGLAASWLVLGLFGVVGGLFARQQEDPITVGFGTPGLTPLQYLKTQPEVILHYLRLALLPIGQCIDYGWPVASGGFRIAVCAALVLSLLGASLWALRKWPWVGFCGVLFFLILSPTSSFIPIRDLAFEHRMYLPLACVLVLIVYAARFLLKRAALHAMAQRVWGGAFATSIALTLIILTLRRNSLYSDPVALWSDNVARTPNHPRPQNALGYALLRTRRLDEAEVHLKEALRLDPVYAGAWANLGVARLKRDDVAGAVASMEKALSISPDEFDAELYYYLGSALFELKRYDDARERFEQALQIRPDFHEALCSLGNALAALGRMTEAEAALQAAIRIVPEYAVAWANLGLVFAETGRPDLAREAYEKALSLQRAVAPRDAFTVQLHIRLARLCISQGRRQAAVRHFTAALSISPADEEARKGLELAEAGS